MSESKDVSSSPSSSDTTSLDDASCSRETTTASSIVNYSCPSTSEGCNSTLVLPAKRSHSTGNDKISFARPSTRKEWNRTDVPPVKRSHSPGNHAISFPRPSTSKERNSTFVPPAMRSHSLGNDATSFPRPSTSKEWNRAVVLPAKRIHSLGNDATSFPRPSTSKECNSTFVLPAKRSHSPGTLDEDFNDKLKINKKESKHNDQINVVKDSPQNENTGTCVNNSSIGMTHMYGLSCEVIFEDSEDEIDQYTILKMIKDNVPAKMVVAHDTVGTQLKDVEMNNATSENNKDDKSENDNENKECPTCGLIVINVDKPYYNGHPKESMDENIALANEKLALYAGDKTKRPLTNITSFSIFDENRRLCPFDTGLVDNHVPIYMSGFLKPVGCDTSDIDVQSVPVKDVGPIIEWCVHGSDGGVQNCARVSTEHGDYNLIEPSADYKPLMDQFYERISLATVVIEYLNQSLHQLPTYEELLGVIREVTVPKLENKNMSEEMLHKHAQFVYEQVASLNTDHEHDSLINLPCMKTLKNLLGIKCGERIVTRANIDYKKVNKKAPTKATTTALVRKTFEGFFPDEIDTTNHESVMRKKRCGICDACQLPDCGECNSCRTMPKFGGHGRAKKACVRRLCANMVEQETEDSDSETDDEHHQPAGRNNDNKIDRTVPVKSKSFQKKNIKWIGEPIKADETRIYYEKVKIDGIEVHIGDYVMIETLLPSTPAVVSRVVYMWRETSNPYEGYFHGEDFIRSTETVLGEAGEPREIFLGDKCSHSVALSCILRKACVERKEIPKDWFKLGGKEVQDSDREDDGKTYFYRKYYSMFKARFEDLPKDPPCPNPLRKHRYCPSCQRRNEREFKFIPRVFGKLAVTDAYKSEWSHVVWLDNEYKKGSGVFLKPGTFRFKNNVKGAHDSGKTKLKKVNEDTYPEYYRKSEYNLRGSNVDTLKPFCIGYIDAVMVSGYGSGLLIAPQDIFLKVKVMYRPENTTSRFPQHEDLNVVYWSDEIKEVPFSSVAGLCHLTYIQNIVQEETIHEWLEKDPCRFYFKKAFNENTGKFEDVPNHAKNVGLTDKGKVKSKGKGIGKSIKPKEPSANVKVDTIAPLRTMDVFAGCGGLSEGLHQAGIAECRWAIENDESAARAYTLNNRGCTVFNEDCNTLLKDVMSGATHSPDGLRLPMQGEVELLCGGPPCQGFSGMNRFNSREYSNFKNSLIASYLSYCDYYRPKYFVLENVRNFVAFKKGMVLKLTMKALLDMGYQCTFGVLQAGNYGVPQTRRRLIIYASAPGFKLPLYPEPTNVFSRRACTAMTTINSRGFVTNIEWNRSAPRRTCTIYDAMSDLPAICSGAAEVEIEYESLPDTHYQRMLRGKDDSLKLRDHICKKMSPLVQARIERIPTAPGSDWRDLPNIPVTLSDGTRTKVLIYRYNVKKAGRLNVARRAVCACAMGAPCSPHDKQENTLIPWCLPHTGNRHNHWAGLYGRLSWDGYFSTTVTDPEPMGKQGRVLHPTQHRVVSVRECARSQGFPDTYMFVGSVQDKHRQIGNAVPPPLAVALGREIKKAYFDTIGFRENS